MALAIRAIYENGQLRLLAPVQLEEGQQVQVTIEPLDEEALMRAALGDLVRWHDPNYDEDAWVEDMAEEIDLAFQGTPPLSEIIIQDRGEL